MFLSATVFTARYYGLTASGGKGSVGMSGGETASPSCSFNLNIVIEKVNDYSCPPPPVQNPVHVEGYAWGINFPGLVSSYQVQVDWGDGTVDFDSVVSFIETDLDGDGKNDDFYGTWHSSPDHIYAFPGVYTVKVKLYHQMVPGVESASAEVDVTVVSSLSTTVTVSTFPEGLTVTVDGVNYTSPKQFNWPAGSTHIIGVPSIQMGSLGERYVWVSWSDGGSQTHMINVPPCSITYTANFKTQYYLDVVSPYGAAGGEGWYDSGSIAYASLDTDVLNHYNGTRRVFASWSGDASGTSYSQSSPILMDCSKTAVADWKTQHLLKVETDPEGLTLQPLRQPAGDVNQDGGWWYDASTNVGLTAQHVEGYMFSYWKVDCTSYEAGLNPIFVDMDAPHIATAYYNVVGVTATVTFKAEGVGSDFTGTVLKVDGVEYAIGSMPVHFSWEIGSTHTFEYCSPLVVNIETKRYVWYATSGLSTAQAEAITVQDGGGTVEASYITQYYLDVQSDYGVTGGEGWYDEGSLAYAEVDPLKVSEQQDVQYVFSCWGGDASGTSSPSNPIIMDAAKTAVAVWKTQHRVYFSQTGSTVQPTVTYVVDSQQPATETVPFNLWVDEGSTIQYSFQETVLNGVFTRHVLAAVFPESPQTVNASLTIVGSYKTQYYLQVISPYSVAGGEGWYDAGVKAYATLASGIDDTWPGTRAVFIGWGGDASGTGLVSSPIKMDAPKRAIAHWKTQYYLALTVEPEGAPDVPGGGWYDEGTLVNLLAPEHSLELEGFRYRFESWTIDGEQALNNPIEVCMSKPRTVLAHYIVQYRLIFNQTGLDGDAVGKALTVNGLNVTVAELPFTIWVDSGSTVNYCYAEVVECNVEGQRFTLESLTGPASPMTIHEAVAVTGNYEAEYCLNVVSPYGSPFGAGWYSRGVTAVFGVTTPVDHGNRTLRVFLKWSGDANLSEPLGTIVMVKPSTVAASWATMYLVTFNTKLPNNVVLSIPNVPKTLPPGMTVYGAYYTAGEHVTVGPAPATVMEGEGTRYVFNSWNLDGQLYTEKVDLSFTVNRPCDFAVTYNIEHLLVIKALGVEDAFKAFVTLAESPAEAYELSPKVPVQQWIRQGANVALTVSTPNKIGHGEWAIFKEWSGFASGMDTATSFTMLSPAVVNAVFFKVNPVALSLPYSLVAGLASTLLCVAVARKRKVEGASKRGSATSGVITMAAVIIVAAIVSSVIAIGYGINTYELVDFTNWAVLLLAIEALAFLFVSAFLVKKFSKTEKAETEKAKMVILTSLST